VLKVFSVCGSPSKQRQVVPCSTLQGGNGWGMLVGVGCCVLKRVIAAVGCLLEHIVVSGMPTVLLGRGNGGLSLWVCMSPLCCRVHSLVGDH
jgi:hypothetical protein